MLTKIIFFCAILDKENNYLVNQINCYILIIPGFGIISTTISAYSNKSVFGQYGSLIEIILLTQQTICKKFKNCYNNLLLLNTKGIRYIIYIFLVKILVILNNPQITKARSVNFKPGIINFSRLSC